MSGDMRKPEPSPVSAAAEGTLQTLFGAICREPIPEPLFDLALRLQEALWTRRDRPTLH